MIDYGYSVKLQALDSSRLELYRGWRNDEKIRKWCRQNTLISMEDQILWFDRTISDPSIKMFEIVVNSIEENIPSGICGLTSIDQLNQRAEFSLYIEPESQGMGLGLCALRTLVSHGFYDLNLNVIWGESFRGNPAIKMFEKIGFKKEGTRRQFYFRNGKFIDAHLFSLTREEFTTTEG